MKSKVWIIVGVGILLVGVGGFLIFKQGSKKSAGTLTPESGTPVLTQAPVENLMTWDDPAGLAFQYDSVLKINNHPEDNINYANLEITQSGQEGKILVQASDTIYKTPDDWVKKDIRFKGSTITETTLGAKPAKKISLADSKRVIIGAIDDKILFTIEMDPTVMSEKAVEQSYFDIWQKRFETITSTFKFVYPTQAATKSAPDTSGSDIIEEEEIIE